MICVPYFHETDFLRSQYYFFDLLSILEPVPGSSPTFGLTRATVNILARDLPTLILPNFISSYMMADVNDGKATGRSESQTSVNEKTLLLGGKSPGVRRIEAIATQFTNLDRVFIFIGVFLIAYAYGLDGSVRYTYQVRSQ